MPFRADPPVAEPAEPPRVDPVRIRVWHVHHPAAADDSLNRVIIPAADEEPRSAPGIDAQGARS
jgi:hypothetical protein